MIGIVAGFILWSGLVSDKDSVVVPVSAPPLRQRAKSGGGLLRQRRNEREKKRLPVWLTAYWTRNAGVTALNCIQPKPELRPNCAPLEPYQRVSRPDC